MPYQFTFHIDNKIAFRAFLKNEQCDGTTKKGHQCRRRVVIGTDLCHQHLMSEKHLAIQTSKLPQLNGENGLYALNKKAAPDAIIFKNGEVIADYIGETINNTTLENRYEDQTAPYAVQISKGKNPPHTSIYEDAALIRGYASLCNQAPLRKHTNARLRANFRIKPHRVQLVATKNIRNNTEILTYYGKEYDFDEVFDTRYVSNKRQ